MLNKLGFDQLMLEDSFSDLDWEVSDDGFMYVGCKANSQSINYNDISLNIRPYVMGWTPQVITNLFEPWLEICLLYETEELIIDYATFKLKDEVKKPIWDTMCLMSQYFHETGTFFTDEISDGHSWEALIDEITDVFSFDAAIIPNKLKSIYKNTPNPFVYKNVESNKLIVNKDIWGEIPWY